MTAVEILAIVSPVVAVIGLILTLRSNAQTQAKDIAAAKDAAIAAAEQKIANMHGEFAAERAKHDQQVDALHSRINDIRDSFVRRDDFAAFAGRIDKSLELISQGQVTLQSTLLQALSHSSK